MPSFICKIFNLVLRLLTNVVDFVASVVTTIGSAVVDVLGDLVETTADALFGGSKTLVWLGVGALAFWWLSSRDDDEPTGRVVVAPASAGGSNG